MASKRDSNASAFLWIFQDYFEEHLRTDASKPLKQHGCNENCIRNPRLCACQFDHYTKMVVHNLVITCKDKILSYTTTKINTSSSSKNLYYLFFSLLLSPNITVYINVVLQLVGVSAGKYTNLSDDTHK